ncbi:helix-turn-helix domain-containing protein [Arthrobacter dokdonensis]|uniref:transcriptional regulator n=1 Tax=Arthrobacter dokdonellae TaxID=2211210 RepID=UPI001D131290|nr:transcriptional regulator [Arthrobacter dokdonellae]
MEETLTKCPVDRAVVDEHRKRMLDVVGAYRVRELSEPAPAQVAGWLYVTQNWVSRIEHGEIDHAQIDTLRKHVEAIGGTLRIEVGLGGQCIQIA